MARTRWRRLGRRGPRLAAVHGPGLASGQPCRTEEVASFESLFLAVVPLAPTILVIYAIFSIAIDARAVRRLLERQEARDRSSV
jgi:hypothetical protein